MHFIAHSSRLALAVWLLFCVGCDTTTTIAADLDEDGANQIVGSLRAHHVAARKERVRNRIDRSSFEVTVPTPEVANAVTVLLTTAMPPADDTRLGPLGSPSTIPTPSEEQARWTAADAARIERTLALWDGVIATRVHIVPSQRASLGGASSPPRAVVVFKHRQDRTPAEDKIRALLSHAIAGLKEEDVSVVLLPTPPATATPLAQIGPIAVTQGSARILKGTLIGTLGLTGLMAGLVLWLWRPARRKRPA